MLLHEVTILAKSLILLHLGNEWRLEYQDKKRVLGTCSFRCKVIRLSRDFVQFNNEEVVKDVILHEIAHGIVPGEGHSEKFRETARRIGGKEVYSRVKASIKVFYKFTYECPKCGKKYNSHRRSGGMPYCPRCAKFPTEIVRLKCIMNSRQEFLQANTAGNVASTTKESNMSVEKFAVTKKDGTPTNISFGKKRGEILEALKAGTSKADLVAKGFNKNTVNVVASQAKKAGLLK